MPLSILQTNNFNMKKVLHLLSDEQAEILSTMSQEAISENTVNCQQAEQWSQVLATCHAKLSSMQLAQDLMKQQRNTCVSTGNSSSSEAKPR